MNAFYQILNKIVIFIHQKVFKPILVSKLKRELHNQFYRLEVRNSALTPEYFHFLYSDFDLALIIHECNQSTILTSRKVFSHFKKIYPFMGEVEIYSREEWSDLENLKKKNMEIYQEVRIIRKYFWMGAPNDFYLSPKRLRALKVILRKLGIRVQNGIVHAVVEKLISLTQRYVKFEEIQGENSYYHTYFTGSFLAPMDFTNLGIKLNSFDLIALAALFPTDNEEYQSNKHLIHMIRNRQPIVMQIWNDLRTIDLLELRASQRGKI